MAEEFNNAEIHNQLVSLLKRLDILLEYLETQDVTSEDNPAFSEMCNFYAEFEQVLFNLHNLIK